MKNPLTPTLTALLLAVTLTACGADPAAATQAATTTTEITTTTAAPTTTEAPAMTEDATTTTRATTTAQRLTTTDIFQQYRDEINCSNMTAQEKKEALKLLEYQEDSNGVMYFESERTPWPPRANYFSQLVYAAVRVKFQYGGQDWLIQMWKGRYTLILLGGEIAVLKKPIEQAAEHYWPATESEELSISMDIYQHNFLTKRTKHLFSRSTNSAWWFNGLVPGSFHEYNKKGEIIMVATITFPNQEMLKAFEEPFRKIGFKRGTPGPANPERYAINGNSLTFSWQHIDQDA